MFDPAKHEKAHAVVIGLGNIGSHTAMALARMGVQKFTLVDFDEVEEHNLSSQAFTLADVGVSKVSALREKLLTINRDLTIHEVMSAYQESGATLDTDTVVFSCVDSMATRYAICDLIEKQGWNGFVIDGRLGGGQLEVHAQPASEWRATLTTDADTDPCGARYISYTSYIIAGCIANTLKRYLQGEKYTKCLLMHTNNYDVIKVMS